MFADYIPHPLRRSPALSAFAPQIFVTAVWLAATRESIFSILADMEALPHWGPPFCERLSLVGGRWLAVTVLGDVWCDLTADASTGVIDLRLDPGQGRASLLVPLRVVKMPGGASLVSLTLPQAPGQSAREFRRMRAALLGALRSLERRFDGVEPPSRRGWRPWLRELENAPPMPVRVIL